MVLMEKGFYVLVFQFLVLNEVQSAVCMHLTVSVIVAAGGSPGLDKK